MHATAGQARPGIAIPIDMSDGTTGVVGHDPWAGEQQLAVDRAIADARNKIYPLHGLDPHDPRD